MKTVKLRPFIPSGDHYDLARRFMQELGFEQVFANDQLSLFRMGEQEFYLQNLHHPELQNNYMVELVVDDLDAWWTHLQAAGLEAKYPVKLKEPTLYPWGKREIHLIDPAGVCWHISEAVR